MFAKQVLGVGNPDNRTDVAQSIARAFAHGWSQLWRDSIDNFKCRLRGRCINMWYQSEPAVPNLCVPPIVHAPKFVC